MYFDPMNYFGLPPALSALMGYGSPLVGQGMYHPWTNGLVGPGMLDPRQSMPRPDLRGASPDRISGQGGAPRGWGNALPAPLQSLLDGSNWIGPPVRTRQGGAGWGGKPDNRNWVGPPVRTNGGPDQGGNPLVGGTGGAPPAARIRPDAGGAPPPAPKPDRRNWVGPPVRTGGAPRPDYSRR